MVLDKLTQQPRLCTNFLLTWFDTDRLLPYHCERRKAAHGEEFSNSWIAWIRCTKSDLGHASDLCSISKERQPQTEDLTEAEVQRAKCDWKESSNKQKQHRWKNEYNTFCYWLCVHFDNLICSCWLQRKVLYLVIDQTAKRSRLWGGILSWARSQTSAYALLNFVRNIPIGLQKILHERFAQHSYQTKYEIENYALKSQGGGIH